MRAAFIVAAASVAALLTVTGQAQAQANRTFVSGHGSDSNSCSVSAPCRTFAQAITQTNASGEIVVLDSAGYGTLTIDRAVSIVNPGGVEAGIAVAAGGTAITINAPNNATVSLRGLTIEGAGIGNFGIVFNTGSRLEIIDCVIRDFVLEGFGFGTSSGIVSLLMSNSIVSDNSNNGVAIGLRLFASSGGQLIATIDHCIFNNNDTGLGAFASGGGAAKALISDSHVDNNVATGIELGGGQVEVRNTTIFQTPTEISLEGNNSVIWLSQVTESAIPPGSAPGISFTGLGSNQVLSDGTNRLAALGADVTLGTWTTQ